MIEWKMVPVEPTKEMIDQACKDHGYPGGQRMIYAWAYASMLAAAPEAVQAEPVGACCYGGRKPKSACGSCAAWTPAAQAEPTDVFELIRAAHFAGSHCDNWTNADAHSAWKAANDYAMKHTPAAQAEPGCLAPVCGGVPAEPCDVCPTAAQAGDELPPLPKPRYPDTFFGEVTHDAYTADQMRAYALAARGAQAEPTGDAEMMLRRIVRRHRAGRPLVDDAEWPAVEAIATRNANPLRAALKGQPE